MIYFISIYIITVIIFAGICISQIEEGETISISNLTLVLFCTLSPILNTIALVLYTWEHVEDKEINIGKIKTIFKSKHRIPELDYNEFGLTEEEAEKEFQLYLKDKHEKI